MSLVHRLNVAFVAVAALFLFAFGASAGAEEIAYNCSEDICVVNPDAPEEKADLTNTNSGNERYPVWSPLGTLIAYTGYYPVAGNETWDIYTFDPAQTMFQSATDISETPDYQEEGEYPNWSPDGTRIGYGSRPVSSPGPLGTQAYVAPADGTALPTPIGSSTANEGEPDFSPDGATVAFLRNASTVWTAPANGTGSPTQLAIAGYGTNWSPDGRFMAGVGSSSVEVTAVDGSGSHALPIPVALNTETIDWSCDSTRLAYVADEEPLDHVRVAPADGSGPGVQIPLPTGWISPHGPRFSPDGTKVAFSARPSSGNTADQIVVAPADGSGVATPVTKEVASGNTQPSWKPGPSCGGSTPPPVSPPSNPGGNPGGGSGGAGSGGSGGSGSAGAGGPKVAGSRKPVKVLLSFFNHPTLDPRHMRIVGIDCHAQGGHPTGEVAEICAAAGNAYTSGSVSTTGLSRTTATGSKSSKVLFAKGAVRVPEGKKKTLALTITKAGQALLATGRRISLKVTVTVKHGTAKAETKTETVSVQRPRHK